MKNDFELIEYEFTPNSDIKIYPISDLHIGAKECLLEEWKKFIKKLKREKNSYITIHGDMMNNGIKSSVTDIYDETMSPSGQKRWLAEQLYDVKDKILCIVPGNHEQRSKKEVDAQPLFDICCELGIRDRYRENAAFIVIRIGDKNASGLRNPSYSLCVIHGSGGGSTTGASVNRNEKFASNIDNLDILIVGHSHKPVVTKPQKIVIDSQNKKVSFKPYTVVTSTSWLEYGGYALRKQLSPASHSLQQIVLKGNQKKVKVTM